RRSVSNFVFSINNERELTKAICSKIISSLESLIRTESGYTKKQYPIIFSCKKIGAIKYVCSFNAILTVVAIGLADFFFREYVLNSSFIALTSLNESPPYASGK